MWSDLLNVGRGKAYARSLRLPQQAVGALISGGDAQDDDHMRRVIDLVDDSPGTAVDAHSYAP